MTIKYTKVNDYNGLLFDFLSSVEDVKRFAYYDNSATNDPTIGVGFNLTVSDVLKETLKGMGFTLDNTPGTDAQLLSREQYYQSQISNIVNGTDTTEVILQGKLDAVMIRRLNDPFYNNYPNVTLRSNFGFSAGKTGLGEMKQVMTTILTSNETIVDGWLQNVVGENPALSIGSKERAALVSMAYNSKFKNGYPSLLGHGLATALKNDD